MFIILSGYHPFDPDGVATDADLKKNILKGEWNLSSKVSDQARRLLQRLLDSNPSHRLTAEELLAHPWINGIDISTAPLDESHRNLVKYQEMRRRFKAGLLANLFEQREKLLKKHSSLAYIGSDGSGVLSDGSDDLVLNATLRALDPDKKGYVSMEAVKGVLQVSEDEASEMVV